MNFPKLYKKASGGQTQVWTIYTLGNLIITEWGQEGGAIQRTEETISSGKNIGKKNETTPDQQAEAEAKSRWEKKQKTNGYSEVLGEASEFVEGGVEVMLAHKFHEQASKIVYPAFVQPKLDGIRCVAIYENGSCTLWSRTRKPIIGVPHINQEVEKTCKALGLDKVVLDGELYNHEFKDDFEHIVHIVKQQKTPDPSHKDCQYHIYDIILDKISFENRNVLVYQFCQASTDYLISVETEEVVGEAAVWAYWLNCTKKGYEGCMVRNKSSKYEGKRSYNLQKVKKMQDAEFVIIGAEEGKGKLAGHCGSFVCKTEEGKTFNVKMKGDQENLVEYWQNRQAYVGKHLTVQFQSWSNKNNVPRFPVGLRFREEGL